MYTSSVLNRTIFTACRSHKSVRDMSNWDLGDTAKGTNQQLEMWAQGAPGILLLPYLDATEDFGGGTVPGNADLLSKSSFGEEA